MSVVRLAEAAGMDKGPISRALAGRVFASAFPSGQPLGQPGSAGLPYADRSDRARKRNQREQLGKEDEAVLLGHVDRLTDMAAKMLKAEKDLN
jgi:hypothetical protein